MSVRLRCAAAVQVEVDRSFWTVECASEDLPARAQIGIHWL